MKHLTTVVSSKICYRKLTAVAVKQL